MKQYKSLFRWLCYSIGTFLMLNATTSCQESKTSSKIEIDSGFVIHPTGNYYSLDVDFRTSNISDYLQYVELEQKEYLISLNQNLNELIFFDLADESKFIRTVFDLDGSNGVGKIKGFSFHTFNKIYLFTNQIDKVFLVDTSAAIIEKYDLKLDETLTPPILSTQYFRSVPHVLDNKIVFKALKAGNFTSISEKEIGGYTIAAGFNFEELKIAPYNITYPKDYWAEGKTHFEYSFIPISDNRICYSFFADHRLFIHHDEGVRINEGQSRFLNEKFDKIPLQGDRNDRRTYMATTQHYGNLFYDEYRKLIYRFAIPKIEIESADDITKAARNKNTFAIQIFDEKGKFLSEQLFSNSNYLIANCFVGKDGLYVSINHPDNPDIQEDKMIFELFRIQTEIKQD